MRLKPRIRRGSQEYDTTIMMPSKNGDYEMDVMVIYSYQPPEPDVGIDGGIEIEGVYFEDEGCQMGEMSDEQIEALANEINDMNVAAWEDAVETYYERERED